MPRENVRDALRLAQQGWKVIPLHTAVEGRCDCNRTPCPNKPGKHPRITNWETRGTDELQQIGDWWGKQWPAANIGVVCGLSGLVVIDIDPRNGGDEALDALLAEHGALPEGPKAITGSGGFHLYFRHPAGSGLRKSGDAGYIGNRAGVRPGIDVRADGGQVVAPPSVYVTGAMYRWEEGRGPEVPVPEMPDWLLKLVRGRTKAAGDFRPTYELPDRIPKGRRHDEFVRWAGFMRGKGASESVIFASLMALNAERTDEQMDENEVASIAASAERWNVTESFVYVGSRPETAERLTGQQLITERAPYRLADIQFLELPPVRWAVPEMVPEGLMILVGPIKQGKSWWAFQTAIAVAEGDVVYDAVSVEDGDVLYLALEDSRRRVKTRGDALLKDAARWPERIEVVDMDTGWPTATMGGCNAIEAWLGQHPDARLVVVDTLQKFRGHDANPRRNSSAYADDYEAMRPLHEIANRHHVAIVLIHHMNKALHDDWVDKISGTTAIGGAADTLSALTSPRGKAGMQDGRWRITGRDVDQQDYAVAFEQGRWRITGNNEDGTATASDPKFQPLLDHMAKRPWEKYSVREIEAALACPTYDAARMLLNRALAAGLVRKAGRGEYRLPEQVFTTEAQNEHNVPNSPVQNVVRFGSVVSETEQMIRLETEQTEQTEQPNNRTTEQRFRGNGVPVSLPDLIKTRPQLPCEDCGEFRWTARVGGRWMCGNCVPTEREVP